MKIHLSKHAVDRYWSRVKPALERDAAERELRQLIAIGPKPQRKPPWGDIGTPADRWLVLCDGICLALIHVDGGYLARTCLTRGGVSPEKRKRRNDKRAMKGRRRRHRELNDKKAGKRRKHGVIPTPPEWDEREAA